MDVMLMWLILVVIFIIVIVCVIGIFIGGKKRKQSQQQQQQVIIQQPAIQRPLKEEKENIKGLESQQLEEIKNLLREHKQLDNVEQKLDRWKKEGYDVSELEQMLEEVKSE